MPVPHKLHNDSLLSLWFGKLSPLSFYCFYVNSVVSSGSCLFIHLPYFRAGACYPNLNDVALLSVTKPNLPYGLIDFYHKNKFKESGTTMSITAFFLICQIVCPLLSSEKYGILYTKKLPVRLQFK